VSEASSDVGKTDVFAASEERLLDLVIACSGLRQSPLQARRSSGGLLYTSRWLDQRFDRHCRKIAPMAAIAGKPLRRVSRRSSSSFRSLLQQDVMTPAANEIASEKHDAREDRCAFLP
jgi:hypothetical protein